MISNIKKVAKAVLAAAQEATANDGCFIKQKLEARNFVLNNAEPMAEALLVLEDALQKILAYLNHSADALCGDDNIGDERFTLRYNQRISETNAAIARANALLEKK